MTHRECTCSSGMHILTGSAHSLYRLNITIVKIILYSCVSSCIVPLETTVNISVILWLYGNNLIQKAVTLASTGTSAKNNLRLMIWMG